MTRELTFATVHHPEFIDDGTWMLVDHPTVRPLQDGEPTLGWDGDPRLAVYLHLQSECFVVWRLEANGEYLPVAQYGLGQSITPESINQTIRDLIRTDSRRGFDPYDAVIEAQNIVDRHQETDRQAQVHELADKMLYGLSRSHLPGVDVTRVRNVTSRR